MKRLLVPVLMTAMIAAIVGCDRNPLFFRLGSNYFPVNSIGSQWEYALDEGGSLIVTVVDQTEIGERACYRVLSGAYYSYWINSSGCLEHYEDHRVMFNGYEVPLYQAWVTWLDWPLVSGNTRMDSATTFAVSQGVTISQDWSRTTTVVDVESSPDGKWTECYHIRQYETTINWIRASGFNPETTAVSRHIWLAPGVGIVASTTADSTLTLVEYQPGN